MSGRRAGEAPLTPSLPAATPPACDEDPLAAGWAALHSANWSRAKACFTAALQVADSPAAHDGLGLALWWLNEIPAAHAQRALAYAGFKQQGDLRRAAGIAAWLAREQIFLRGNRPAMQGWFARAERLLAEAGACPERGWYILLRASLLDAPADLERAAQQAITIAREFGDTDLETLALAFLGMARVAGGAVGAGMGCLDEAMAAATGGEVTSFTAISEIFCVMLSACELTGDMARTEGWCQIAADFAARHHCSFLSAYCRTTYGGLLAATGRWRDAEAELLAAISAFEAGHRGLRVHAVLKLADLRVRQGRLEEAAALLSGYEDQGSALVPLARLHFARGETALARAVLDRALPAGQARTLDQVPFLLLLVEVTLAMGDLAAAQQTTEQLAALARQTQSEVLLAQAAFAAGQVQRQAGEPAAAGSFQSVLTHMPHEEQSLLAARARLEMAQLLADSDWAGAVTWARAALASFERIGAEHDAAQAAALLRRLGVTERARPRSDARLSRRESDVLELLARGLTNREIAARLVISPKTAEHHVSQILGKLGLRSRAEAAAWLAHGSADAADGPTARAPK